MEGVVGIYDEKIKQLNNFEMRPDLYVSAKYAFLNSFTSKTIAPMYVSLAIILNIIYFYL
jgi:hypothetical protein